MYDGYFLFWLSILYKYVLTHYLTMKLKQIAFKMENKYHMGRKHCEKRRNCLLQAISPFLTMFSTAI